MSTDATENDLPQFFYRYEREGFVVKKIYVGSMSNPVVALLARCDRLRKAIKTGRFEKRINERAEYEDTERWLIQYYDQFWDCLSGWMRRRGLHFQRGQWQLRWTSRKSRRRRNQKPMMGKFEFDQLVDRASQGDADALNELRQTLQSDRLTWRPFGDLSEHVKRRFLNLLTAGDLVGRESLQINLSELEESLRRDQASPIRELAIDQVLICWLDVRYQELMAADPREGIKYMQYLDRRLERARRRYDKALQSLAQLDEILGVEPQTSGR
jgi:hypothetical protein